MTPERYRQIGELYHAALEVDAGERPAFLEQACAGDAELRREVESLITSHERASDFIAEPALAVAAELFAEGEADALTGQAVSHYKILSLIGAGGMGQVYLAEDTQLRRRVALKLLPEHFTSDSERVRRFRQEARAASALNHPNIITIHEIGKAGERHYIATEFIEGETLRERLDGGRLRPAEALDMAAQMASALAAAHEAGILHRDVKPENVMIRRDGYVKVLDFGLAKLTERPTLDVEAPTVSMIKTDPGSVMGTVTYMSPEQARGLQVDARTDVWSLGVVLYEMIAGRRPFVGATTSDVIVSILEREPPPLARDAPEAPAELERIVTKALTKNADERYQTAKDMAIDLRRLKRRQEVEAEMERPAPTEAGAAAAATVSTPAGAESAGEAVTPTGEVGPAHQTTSVEYIVGEIKRHKPLALAALLVICAGLSYAIYRYTSPARPTVGLPRNVKFTRLTSGGVLKSASLSPDGKFVALVADEGGRQSLRLRQVMMTSEREIVPAAEGVQYVGLTFTSDGTSVYYVTVEARNGIGTLYRVPLLGGDAQKLIADVDSPVTVSPDGKRLAFVRSVPKTNEARLVVANVDGSGAQTLQTRQFPQRLSSPAWSPDGQVIAYAIRDIKGNFTNIEVMRVTDGTTTPISVARWTWLQSVAWLADGSGLIINGLERGMHSSVGAQIWQVSYPGSEAHRITNDLNNYDDVSLTADSQSLLTVQRTGGAEIWVVPGNDPGRARQIMSSSTLWSNRASWTPDSRLVFDSLGGGNPTVRVMNADGSGGRQLTSDTETSYFPTVAPDGRFITFLKMRGDTLSIWKMDADGGNARELLGDVKWSTDIPRPLISPDGRWVYYTLFYASAWPALWRLPSDGGEPEKVRDNCSSPSLSTDGKHFVALAIGPEPAAPAKMIVFPAEGVEPVRTLDAPPDACCVLSWSPDGRAVDYVATREGATNIWRMPLGGGQPSQLTRWKTAEGIKWFAWSPDGQQLAVVRRTRTVTDLVLIQDFR